MSDTDATISAPTPNNMPGVIGSLGEDTSAPGQVETLEDDLEEESTLSVEDLAAERDKWKRQAQTNEKRAKSNAEKAKAYDADFEKFKAAYEREQAKGAEDPVEEDSIDNEQADRAAEAEARAAEAEAKLLRFRLADGLPEWLTGLIDGTTEEEIEEQVESLKENLAAYVASISEPRRPAPNPLAGRSGQLGTSPQEAFSSAFSNILR